MFLNWCPRLCKAGFWSRDTLRGEKSLILSVTHHFTITTNRVLCNYSKTRRRTEQREKIRRKTIKCIKLIGQDQTWFGKAGLARAAGQPQPKQWITSICWWPVVLQLSSLFWLLEPIPVVFRRRKGTLWGHSALCHTHKYMLCSALST